MRLNLKAPWARLRSLSVSQQLRLLAVIASSVVACMLVNRWLAGPMPTRPFSTWPDQVRRVSVSTVMRDKASRDTAEEILATVAAGYDQLLQRVTALQEQQRQYQAATERTIRSLRETIAALKTQQPVKASTAMTTPTITAPASTANVLPPQEKAEINKTALPIKKRQPEQIAAAVTAITPTPSPAPADPPLTLINDLSLPASASAPPAVKPALPVHRHMLAKKPVYPVKPVAPANHEAISPWPALPAAPATPTVKKPTPPTVIPYYTLPANATGLQATLMTALVGRLPVKGHVQDPYPFKLILGPENLAANGLKLPDVAGMVVAGFAVGDLTLHSVKGWITSVTFVFPDGRIHTVQAQANGDQLPTQATRLGYLSDPYGNPFLPGKLITNAPRDISTQLLLGEAQGMAGALAHSSLVPTAAGPGIAHTPSAHHLAQWLAKQTAQQATTQINHWWQDRHAGAFDAIYVPAGRPVVINFTRSIAIDYHTQGRKLRYEHTSIQTSAPSPTGTPAGTLSSPSPAVLPDAPELD